MNIEIYTDGSATTSNLPGGYGWVFCIDGVKYLEGNGYMPKATNNDAEMQAAIAGLSAVLAYRIRDCNVHEEFNVTLLSDSQITLNWANGTYRFKQEAKMEKFNQLKELMRRLNAKTQWVRGHSGNEHNERCDKLANWGRKQIPIDTVVKVVKPGNKRIVKCVEDTIFVNHKGVIKVVDFHKGIVYPYIE